jgi:hypothetical protein
MDAIFEVFALLAKAIGKILQYCFEVVCEVLCFPMMIVALVTFVYASEIKFDSDRWNRRGTVFLAFFHLLFDLCIFLPA